MCSYDDSSPVGRNKPLELLEREITELASHIHAATCRWLGLVAEFDRREGWADWGCRSCAHWVSWRCGIAPPAAREHVRVARRLESMPVVRAAFAEGRLSYSKVRALTRVEEVEREDDLLSLAEHATAAQLERLVRAYRGVVAVERAEPERWVTWSHDSDGSLLLRARLPAEEGALVVAALEAAREAAWERVEAGPEGASAGASGVPEGVSAETSGGAKGVSAEAPEVEGDASAEAPATGGEALADALVLMADTMLASGPAARTGGDRHQVLVHVDAAVLAGTPDAAGCCELADGSPIAPETARRLACDASIVALTQNGGRTLDIGRKTRSIPPALRRALAARDRGCRFPGCDRARVDAHHIHHWARGGGTSLDNLVHLCRRHHGLVHEGGFTVERRDGGELVFRRPDGRRIAPCPAVPAGRVASMRTRGIRHDACVQRSTERMDLGYAVDAMLEVAPPGRARAGEGAAAA